MEYDTIKLLNLEDIDVDLDKSKVDKVDNALICTLYLKRKPVSCLKCGSINNSIKDYQSKTIVHSISTNQPCKLNYKARRYICKDCGAIFYEENPFCNKDEKISTYTDLKILEKLRSHTATFSSVAKDLNVSITTVINVFDKFVYPKRLKLPNVLCIDEIYTNKLTHRKYTCILMNFITKQVVDVYPTRLKRELGNEFNNIPKKERDNVKYVIIDMWDSYNELATSYFSNCIVAVDSFHVMKHLSLAMDMVRLKIMRKFDRGHSKLENSDIYYYMLKKFHYFFNKNYDNIYDGLIDIPKMRTKWTKEEIRKYLLSIDDDLKYAYELKNKYQEFNATAEYDSCDTELNDIIIKFSSSHLEEFREFGRLINHWKKEIKNSFIRINISFLDKEGKIQNKKKRLSNGPMEGCNSRIKCIIKNANGYRNFDRFRRRILFTINKNTPIKNYNK